MKTTFLKSLTGFTATMLLAGYAGAQVTVPEVEGNETKATSTPAFGLLSGDMLTGTTTGTSTTAVGAANSADVFRVKTAAAPLNVYRHRLVLTTTGTAGHTGAIMGLGSAGTPTETTNVLSSGTGTTPARMVQWYGFGKEEELFYKVTGGTATTAPYVANYTRDPVTVINAGTIAQGTVVMTTVGQGHTTDTEMFLYDANFNLLRLNDDEFATATTRSRITQNLTPGVYYLAISQFNTATSSALEPTGAASGENTTTGNRMDFPNSIVGSTTTTNANVGFSINDALGAHPFAATRSSYEVVFAQFTVIAAQTNPGVAGNTSAGLTGSNVLITGTVTPGQNPASTGIAVTADLTAFGGSSTQALVDDGTGGDVTAGDNVYSYTLSIPGAQASGSYTVNLAVSDAEARSGSGTATVLVDEAGNLPGNARHIGTGPVTSVSGSITPNDVDMFRLFICDPASFSATVTSAGTTLADSQLFLFRPDGMGVAFNDDQAASALSQITGPITAALAPGEYYLAIADYNNDARDAANALIWANSPFTGVRAPDGPGAANPLASWDTGGGDTGTYTIALVGVNGDGCAPPTGSCCLGQYCFVATADDCTAQGGSFGGAGTDCSTGPCAANCGSSDFNHDGDFGTDADIEAFFACLGGVCCPTCDTSDFNGDSDFGTDADIEAFFRVLSGGAC